MNDDTDDRGPITTRARITNCSTCGAPFQWIRTNSGAEMPVNWNPDDPVRVGDKFDHKRHVSHFVTCPHADKHRKRKPPKRAQ